MKHILLSLACSFCLFPAAADDAETPNELAQFYGFSGVELYKLDQRAFGLCEGDFDSDGLTDVLAVDNRASCLRFFRQQSEAKQTGSQSGRFVNRLMSDWRFDIRQIPVDKQVAGMVTGDFNGNGRTDIAYIGTPDRLIIRYQPDQGKTEWTERFSVRLPDLAPAAYMIAEGDLNGDRRTDIAVLGKTATYLILQGEEGSMNPPQALINTSAQLSLLQIADVNGDGREDLSYQSTEGAARGLCARLQKDNGRLGPELRFDLNQPRSVTLYNVDQEPGEEILTVDSRTGRVVISQVRKGKSESELPTRLVQYGVGEGTGREKRAVAIGDIDGDKRNDVVVTDPEKAQVLVYRQNGIDGLGVAETFPGLLGAIGVLIEDMDGDGTAEVILLSDNEAAVAVSHFSEGRLQFPEVIHQPESGIEPAAMAVYGKGESKILAICEVKGSGSSASLKLHQLTLTKDGWKPVGKPVDMPPGAVGARGVHLRTLDADRDGISDLLAIPNGTSKGVILLPGSKEGEADARWNVAPLNLGTSTPGAIFVHEDLLYVARESFARMMQFKDGKWAVADQFNAGESKARLAGVAVLDLHGDETDEIVLVDTGVKRLRVLRKTEGLYRPWKELELGTIKYDSSHVADLNGDGRDDLLLFGAQQFSVLYSGNTGESLVEVATWESDRENAYAADIIAGDINSDGATDLTVIDTSIDGLELLNLDADRGLQAATHFRVFEEKRLVSKTESRGTQPREGLIVDVTGDGRNDIVLLCHDRLIVYPQDVLE